MREDFRPRIGIYREEWVPIETTHHAEQHFDSASCLCGWSTGGPDIQQLIAAAEAHNREHAGEIIKMRKRRVAPFHEWKCPSCGSTTRERMADE